MPTPELVSKASGMQYSFCLGLAHITTLRGSGLGSGALETERQTWGRAGSPRGNLGMGGGK